MRHRTGSAISTALLSTASALLIVSCAPRATQPPREDARAVAERFVAAFSEGDQEELRALFAEEVQWDLRGIWSREGVGRDALLEVLRMFRERVPDVRLESYEVFVDGEIAMVCGRLRGAFAPSVQSLTSTMESSLHGDASVRLRLRGARIEALRWAGDSMTVEETPSEDPPEATDEIAWVTAALDLAGPARAITLDPYPSQRDPLEPELDPRSGERLRFEEFSVTGSAPIEDESQRRELSRLLYRGLYFGDGGANCFQPRHALEIDWQGQKLWVVICFECSRGYVEGLGGRIVPFDIGSPSEPGFSEIYRALGLTLAPKID
ncbi:MAG: nuclear transport factor 2 family protein [Planctomycetes bacterium]|nr:nuclear transport factor 2 family protein [Planctomycetota bacterium]